MDFMIRLEAEWLTGFAWGDLLGMALRLTLIFSLGHLFLALGARRMSAAARHVIAVAVLAAGVLWPLATAVLPSRPELAVPGRVAAAFPQAWRPVPESPAPRAPQPAMTGPRRVSATPVPGAVRAGATAHAAARNIPAIDAPTTGTPMSLGRPALMAAAAAGVSVLLLLRLLAGFLWAGFLLDGAVRVSNVDILADLDHARALLRVPAPIELRSSERVTVPVVFGLAHPVLVLPVPAAGWSRARRRAVLLHEVAHVRRCDAPAALLTRIATALLWFHPLSWTLAREAQRMCERACDDAVLECGVRASDYADHLLDIARSGRGRAPGLALAFARGSSLEGRLLALLRPDARRGAVSRRRAVGLAGLALAVTLPLAAVRVTAAPEPVSRPAGVAVVLAEPVVRADAAPVVAAPPMSEPSVACPSDTDVDRDGEDTSASAADETGADFEVAGTRRRDDDRGADAFGEAAKRYEDGRYAAAATAYERAARAGFRVRTSWYNAACAYALAGQKGPALEALTNAYDAGFDHVQLLQADTDLNALRSDPRFQLLVKGFRNSEGGRTERAEARSKYEALRHEGSADADGWHSVGVNLLRLGDADLALDAFERQYRIEPSSSVLYNQACAYAQTGDATPALAKLEEAILKGTGDGDDVRNDPDLFPLHGKARFTELEVLATDLTLRPGGPWDDNAQRWRQELPRLERVSRERPRTGRAWFNLGYAQLRAEKAPDGRASFQRALDLGFRPPVTMYDLACTEARLGHTDAALDWLDRAEAAGMDLSSHIGGDEDLASLRSNPRFRERLRAVAQAEERMRERKVERKVEKAQEKERVEKRERAKERMSGTGS